MVTTTRSNGERTPATATLKVDVLTPHRSPGQGFDVAVSTATSLPEDFPGEMYGGFLVLFPPLRWGHVSAGEVVTGGHVLTLLFILVAMLARPDDYDAVTHAHSPRREATNGPEQGA